MEVIRYLVCVKSRKGVKTGGADNMKTINSGNKDNNEGHLQRCI